jgi:hypothetical protein
MFCSVLVHCSGSSADLPERGGKMPDERAIQGLAGAAGYLCSAFDELSATGYDAWSSELKQLIDIVAAEISWLQQRETSIPMVRRQT